MLHATKSQNAVTAHLESKQLLRLDFHSLNKPGFPATQSLKMFNNGKDVYNMALDTLYQCCLHTFIMSLYNVTITKKLI